MKENKQIEGNFDIHVGPEVNCGDNVVYIEINEKRNLICNCSKVNFKKLSKILKLKLNKIIEVLPIKLLSRSWYRYLA